MEYPLNAIDYYYRTEGDDQPGQRKQFRKLCDTDRRDTFIQVYRRRSLLAVKVQIKKFSFPICKMGKEFLDLYYCAERNIPSFFSLLSADHTVLSAADHACRSSFFDSLKMLKWTKNSRSLSKTETPQFDTLRQFSLYMI